MGSIIRAVIDKHMMIIESLFLKEKIILLIIHFSMTNYSFFLRQLS